MVGRLRGLPRPLGGRGEDPGLVRRLTGDSSEVTGEAGAETLARGEGGVLKPMLSQIIRLVVGPNSGIWYSYLVFGKYI